jgi:hypothetical protein
LLKQIIYELGRGFAYRSISHSEMRIYTTWLPLALTFMAGIFYVLVPVKPSLVGTGGLVQSLMTLVSTLPGFYFAGLAAVATFGSDAMDQEMPDPAPEVELRVRGQYVRVKLTRRSFLSYLFSYLVILSFGLCFAILVINSLTSSTGLPQAGAPYAVDVGWLWLTFHWALGLILTFAFASLIVSTLHGIFFLTEKIHQP